MKLNEVYNIDEAMQHTHENMHDDDYEDCSACSGTGEGRWEGTTCNVCHGTGVEPSDQDDDGYDDVEDEPAELTPFEPEAEYEKYVRTKGLGEAEATTAQRVAAAPYGYNGQTGKPNPAPVAQPAAPVVDQAAIDRQAAKFGLPPGSTKEQLVAAIQSKNFAQPAAQPAPAAVAQPAAQPAPVKGAVGQAAIAADAAGQNAEAAALAAMQKKNPKLAALMAQAGMNPDGTDMQQGVAEARKASTKAARAEFGRRTSSRPTLSDKEQAKKKAESDAAWARLMAYADEQKNKEQGVAEGSRTPQDWEVKSAVWGLDKRGVHQEPQNIKSHFVRADRSSRAEEKAKREYEPGRGTWEIHPRGNKQQGVAETKTGGNALTDPSTATHTTHSTIWPGAKGEHKMGPVHHRSEEAMKGHVHALKKKYGAGNVSTKVQTNQGVAEGKLTEASIKLVDGQYQVVHNGKVVGTYPGRYAAQDHAHRLNNKPTKTRGKLNANEGVAEGFDLNNKSTSNTNSSPEFRGVNIPGNMKHPDWNEPAWSFQEVADKLGISASELNGYVAMLPGFPNKSEGLKSKYGSKAYFPRSAIKRWVNATNIRDIIKSKKGVAEDSNGGITESPDYAAMFEAKLTEMGAGSIATSIAAPNAKAGTLFGGDYSQKNSPFKKNKPKKTGMIKR